MFVAGRRPSCPYFELQLPESNIKEAYVPLRCVLVRFFGAEKMCVFLLFKLVLFLLYLDLFRFSILKFFGQSILKNPREQNPRALCSLLPRVALCCLEP